MDTIYVVSDYPVVQEGLYKIFSRRGYKVEKAKKSVSINDIPFSNDAIKLIIIDLAVKENNGNLQLADDLREQKRDFPVFLLISNDDLNLILAAEETGVDGIALRNESIQVLVDGVRKVLSGEKFRSPEYDQEIKKALEMRKLISAKDREVLRRLTLGEANRDIAQAMGLSEKTVEYHRSNILKKLGARSMFEATRRALHLGLID